MHLTIPLTHLVPHPANSNVMPAKLFTKLVTHIGRTGRYPPVIVRPLPDAPRDTTPGAAPRYQILDGHHRVRALAQIRVTEARCVVWEVGDAEALTLLATLNRLQGRDDPHKRAALVGELAALPEFEEDAAALAKLLPEDGAALRALLALNEPAPEPEEPVKIDAMLFPVHFFLVTKEREALEARLAAIGGTREEALMKLVSVQ